MTYLEKFKQEHPGKTLDHKGLPKLCPVACGYEKECLCAKQPLTCEDCWNREIPETETNEREETKMENTTPAIYSTRKTKAQLLEEIADLKKQLVDATQYEAYDECATQIAAMCRSFETAGFSRAEAIDIAKLLLSLGANMPKR